jgi:uncharacterized membrane protein
MALPVLNIPELPAGMNIPVAEMIHPMITHFAIALPVVIILLEIINLAVKRRSIGAVSFVFMLILAVVLYFSLLSGDVDTKKAGDLLSVDAKELLRAHKQLSIYLFYASLVLMLFKLLSVLVQKTALKVLFLLIAIAFTAGIFSSGKKGCMLVFQHGINIKSVTNAKKTAPSVSENMNKETNTQAEDSSAKKSMAAVQPVKQKSIPDNNRDQADKNISTAPEAEKAVASSENKPDTVKPKSETDLQNPESTGMSENNISSEAGRNAEGSPVSAPKP